MLKSERCGDPGTDEILDEVLKQIDRMEKLTKDLLSYSKPYEPKLLTCSVNEILDETLFLMELSQEHPNLAIRKEYDEALPEAEVDPRQIQQVFLNLLVNAAQAMPEGGEVRIRTGTADEGGGRCLWVEIADDGPGMSAETLRRAMDPFFTTKHKGTGLGLSIVQKIMESHGGTLTVQNPPSGGTTCRLSFRL